VTQEIDRRKFLKLAGVGAGAAALAGASSLSAQDSMPMQDATPAAGAMDNDAMDTKMQQGVQTFLDNIGKDTNFWLPPMEPTMDGNVKVYELTCTEINWETQPGQSFPAMAFNGQVPGPTIRITEGDQVRIIVHNQMTQSTGVHFHGVRLPNNMDGVPFVTQPPIKPGESFTHEFTATNFGSHMYHSHHNAAEQVVKGLLGAFIIDPKDTSREPQVSGDYVLILNDSGLGFTLNGRSFPYTQPIAAKIGDKIRVRYLNEGLMIHPFHLHGISQLVFAKDGHYLPAPYMADTVLVAPGERYDVLVDCDVPGYWAFHCHILTHAEARDGMFGMVTVLAVS
jgi:FtsP/CotA-like multicopper oxidase with cupredoxin domain